MAEQTGGADAVAALPEAQASVVRTPRRRSLNPRIVVAGGIIMALTVLAIVAPLVAPYDPLAPEPTLSLAPPSSLHPLGNDEFGRDVLSRLIWGARISMTVSIASVLLALVVGATAGLIAGYYGSVADWTVMRSADVILSIPPVLLAIGVVAILGPSIPNLVLTIAIVYAPRFARVAYSSTRAVRGLDYVQATLAVGARESYVLRRAIVPAILAPLIVQASLALGAAMLLESGLSFIGLGARPPTPSWGSMVSSARAVMERFPLLVFWPSAVLAVTILAFNVLGDGVRDALDPRSRR
ncbi:MAG TPA: ABC transporter permease [Chloroflexota bacterium]|nr:ABC transporter permease [Chloroflexota bacterium]